jgi:4-hydroxyphenylpyruvate dioxygenase
MVKQLVGCNNFKRNNPLTDKFECKRFHHIEFYCADATNVSARFGWGLGLQRVAKSDLSTGNSYYASYCMKSADIVFVFTGKVQLPVSGSLRNLPQRVARPI